MENLSAALSARTLEQIRPVANPNAGSNLIEPTAEEIGQVVDLFKGGASYTEIKLEVIRNKGAEGQPQLKLSFDQIGKIYRAWQARVVELTPKEEEVIPNEGR